MNRFYRDKIIIAIKGSIAEANAAQQMDHQYLKGRIREISVRGLIEPWLSKTFGTGTGKVTDCNGRLSNETDIIVYARDVITPVVYSEDGFGLYPCECCLVTIEVKSKLTADELRSALRSSAKLSSNYFEFLSGRYNLRGTATEPHQFMEIVRCLFAFDTDLVEDGRTEVERYQEYARPEEGERLDGLCVVGRGFWVDRRTPEGTNRWTYIEATEDHEEVISFCSVLSSSLAVLYRDRGRPPIGRYFTQT